MENQDHTGNLTEQSEKIPTATESAPQESAPAAEKQEPARSEVRAVLDEESLRKLAETLRPKEDKAQPQRQLSPEEVARMFNVYNPDESLVRALREAEETAALDAVRNMVNGIVRYATTVAQYQMAQQLQQLMGQLQPHLQVVEQMQMERLKSEFFEKYPDLKGYEPLLAAVRDRLVASGAQFRSKEEAFRAVAEEAKKILQTLPGNQGNNGAGQRLPPSMASDRPGTGTGQGTQQVMQIARELFG